MFSLIAVNDKYTQLSWQKKHLANETNPFNQLNHGSDNHIISAICR